MSNEIFSAVLRKIRNHVILSKQKSVNLSFHGGEPCLIGTSLFRRWCSMAVDTLADIVDLDFSLQTNGTLLDSDWAQALTEFDVGVSLSLDGPPKVNDAVRVDHSGGGSHEAVIRGIQHLSEAGIDFTILCVCPLGEEPLAVHTHLLSLSPTAINYLFPDSASLVRRGVNVNLGTPLADFLIPIFEDWWRGQIEKVDVILFRQMARMILGGHCKLDIFGNGPLGFLFIESDGSIESLDVLRICGADFFPTHLNVLTDEFIDVETKSSFASQVLRGTIPIPDDCSLCPENKTCAGGYLPHRWRPQGGFNHCSIWCTDILKLFRHVRFALNVTPEETYVRRTALNAFSIAR